MVCPLVLMSILLLTVNLSTQSQSSGNTERHDLLPKKSWKAEASSVQETNLPASNAIDGDPATRWSSQTIDPSYLIIDLGQISDICGVVILWESAFASEYFILASVDKNRWDTVYSNYTGNGKTDDIFFTPCKVRYIKILGTKRATGWGYSIYEVDVKGLDENPVVTVNKPSQSLPGQVLDGNLNSSWQSSGDFPCDMVIDFKKEKVFNGLQILWGQPWATALTIAVSKDGKNWETVAELTDGIGGSDLIPCETQQARYAKLTITASSGNQPVRIREITIPGPEEVMTPLALYQIAAAKSKPGWYPDHLRKRQLYWTLAGMPGDREESILDEYGNLEPFRGSCSLMPYLYSEGQLYSAFDASRLTQAMVLGSLPLPSVTWELENMKFTIEAVTRGGMEQSVTWVRYTVVNTSKEVQTGKLFLAARPVQVNPAWQYGGLSPISSLALVSSTGGFPAVEVNGREMFVSFGKIEGFGVTPFNKGDIIGDISKGVIPDARSLNQNGDYLSGALEYGFNLKPGASKEFVIAAPLFKNLNELNAFVKDDLAGQRDPGRAFSRLKEEMTGFWQRQIHQHLISLPDTAVVNTLNAQVGYILINRDGVSIQPGSRNYKRSWMRDGSLTSAAMLRLGQKEIVKPFLEWYAASILPNGLVPPVLNNDGSVNGGFGSNLEWDSQGEFIYAMTEYFRFTRDTVFLRQHYDKIKLAMKFMVELRERTLVPGYMKDEPPSSRFAGILPGSISHEGYSTPTHSYWDDFFALKGWKDGRMIATTLGDGSTADWAAKQYQLLRSSVKASVEETMAWKQLKYIPGSADKGDLDPTSTTIAFFPCEEQDILPVEALNYMYDNYYNEVQGRATGPWHGSYTPYEIRNITAFDKLGKKDRAAFLLDFITSHRRPAAWNHLAEVVYGDQRLAGYIGDMPHTWVGSGYINAVRGMIVSESGDMINLFEGAPTRWFNGEGIRLTGLPTWFGLLTLHAFTLKNRLTVEIAGACHPSRGFIINWPDAKKPLKVTVDGEEWSDYDNKTCRVPAGIKRVEAEW